MTLVFNSRGEPVSPLDVSLIPETTLESLDAWGAHEILRPGSFVMAVLSGDLFEAVGRADERNIVALPAIVSYIYNVLPRGSWGDPEMVRDWEENGVAAGRYWKAMREKERVFHLQTVVAQEAEDAEPGSGNVGVSGSETADEASSQTSDGINLGPDSSSRSESESEHNDSAGLDLAHGELPWEALEGDDSTGV